MEVKIAGYGPDAEFDGLRGFVAGRGAKIEKGLAGVQIEKRDHGLRLPLILDAPGTGVCGFRRVARKRSRDLVRCFHAELAVPSFEQPGRHGEFNGAVGPRDVLAIRLSQNGVHQSGSGRFVSALYQLDAFAHRGMGWNAVQIAELIDAHAQRDEHFGIGRTRNAASDQIIELGLITEASKNDFGREAVLSRESS